MVRILFEKAYAGDLKYAEIVGTKDDDKPVAGLITGSKFTEVDTGDVYLLDEEDGGTWTKVQAGYVEPTVEGSGD